MTPDLLKRFILDNADAPDEDFKFDVLFLDPATGTQHSIFTEGEHYT